MTYSSPSKVPDSPPNAFTKLRFASGFSVIINNFSIKLKKKSFRVSTYIITHYFKVVKIFCHSLNGMLYSTERLSEAHSAVLERSRITTLELLKPPYELI